MVRESRPPSEPGSSDPRLLRTERDCSPRPGPTPNQPRPGCGLPRPARVFFLAIPEETVSNVRRRVSEDDKVASELLTLDSGSSTRISVTKPS